MGRLFDPRDEKRNAKMVLGTAGPDGEKGDSNPMDHRFLRPLGNEEGKGEVGFASVKYPG